MKKMQVFGSLLTIITVALTAMFFSKTPVSGNYSPNTGDDLTLIYILIGVGVLAVIAFILLGRRRK